MPLLHLLLTGWQNRRSNLSNRGPNTSSAADRLSKFLFQYRTPRSTTGVPPGELVMGRRLCYTSGIYCSQTSQKVEAQTVSWLLQTCLFTKFMVLFLLLSGSGKVVHVTGPLSALSCWVVAQSIGMHVDNVKCANGIVHQQLDYVPAPVTCCTLDTSRPCISQQHSLPPSPPTRYSQRLWAKSPHSFGRNHTLKGGSVVMVKYWLINIPYTIYSRLYFLFILSAILCKSNNLERLHALLEFIDQDIHVSQLLFSYFDVSASY